MFLGMGLGELILIALVILVVVPADDFPKILQKLGYYCGKLSGYYSQTQRWMRDSVNKVNQTK